MSAQMAACDYCGSIRGVEPYTNQIDHNGPRIDFCEVCSRLWGTGRAPVTLDDINRNIVILFQTLGLVPHDTDAQEGEK